MSFCPLPLLYPSASDFQFRYAPVTVGSGRAAYMSLGLHSVLNYLLNLNRDIQTLAPNAMMPRQARNLVKGGV